MRRARVLVKRLRSKPPDVLYLGDSTTLFVGPDDSDQRNLAQMIRDELSTQARVHVVADGGYNPELHEAYLRLVPSSSARPLILHSLVIRLGCRPWFQHPVYGYRRQINAIRELDPSGPTRRIRAALPKPMREEYERLYDLEHKTLIGDLKVGDYVRPLRDGSLDPAERFRLLFGYHHGAELVADSPEIAAVGRLGRTLSELGARSVAYQTPVPVQTGVETFGPGFASLVDRNWGVINDAYRKGRGSDAALLETGAAFASDEFIDPADASEHLNEMGRARLARTIADAVRAELERR